MEGIREPVDRATLALLRRAVADHASAEQHRRHPPLIHVGEPGRPHTPFTLVPDEPDDHGIRTDVVAAMLSRARRDGVTAPLVWVTRHGEARLEDTDAAWLAAARAAYAEAGVPLRLVVVTRHGWRDPRSGVGRAWKRIRDRER